MDHETTLLALSNRAYLYSLLARGFAEEADSAFLELLASEHTRQELGLVASELTDEIRAAHDAVLACTRDEDALTRIRREYVDVFVGPGTPKAYPWETVHLSSIRTLFKPELMDVRDAYRAAGFLPARYPHVQDDFIGLELDFMAKLASAALTAWNEGDEPQATERLGQSRAFLEEHLLRWIDSLADAIATEYGDNFFARFTRLAALVSKRDLILLS